MRRSLIVLSVITLVLAVAALWVVSSPDAKFVLKQKQIVTDQNKINQMVIGYVGNPYPDDYQSYRVPGYMQNQSKTEVVAVNLEISLYNAKGDRKEVIKFTVRDVAAGQRKSFDANAGILDGPRNAKVKILSLEVVR